MNHLPIIGLSTHVEEITFDHRGAKLATFILQQYVEHVYAAGALPLLISTKPDYSEQAIADLLAALDGLILVGGSDVNPMLYDEYVHPEVYGIRPSRDKVELALSRGALELDLPTMGICRGMQILAVSEGGKLVQHLGDVPGIQKHGLESECYITHPVQVARGSKIAQILGECPQVQSYHHQAVRTHPGFTATAWAEDGTIEAIEHNQATYRIGVQWHPEQEQTGPLFEALVNAAAQKKAQTAPAD